MLLGRLKRHPDEPEKYATYVPADIALAGQGRKVQLTRNFRSGGGVLAGVNDVFYHCMSPAVGGLVYDENEALVEGTVHESLTEPEVEFWALDVQESTYLEESGFVAQRVQELLDGTHMVRGKEGLRPIVPEDIAILLRSPGSTASYFVNALSRLGIRSTTGGGEDILQSREVSALCAFLQTISNPRQDIPLIATLTSPIFGFTADDLAAFRSKDRYCSVYDALLRDKREKTEIFLQILGILRKSARLETLAQLIEKIFTLTHMDSIFAAMPDGEKRRENLLYFYQYAASFERDGHRDLEQFLNHLASLGDQGLIVQGQQTSSGAVTIMSIHKSKGLEFPVVFVSNLSREFNRESIRAQVLCDQRLGVGVSAVDTKNRVRYPTIAKRAIAAKTVSDSLSEEMRVLYVALTRARDRLIMTYAAKKVGEDVAAIAYRLGLGNGVLPSLDAVCPGDWVMQAALRRTEAGELFALGAKPQETSLGQPPWLIHAVTYQEAPAECMATFSEEKSLPEDVVNQMKIGLSYRYPQLAATQAPSKQTATQRKGREKDAEAAELTQQPLSIERNWHRANFHASAHSGADYGTATHVALQYIHFSSCDSEAAVSQELTRLVARNLLTQDQRKMVDCGKLFRFLQTPIGMKIRNGGEVIREFKFSILDDGRHYSAQLQDEEILLQGVVDCAVIEDDGITIIDFKTDYITEETLQHRVVTYRPQVKAYTDALQRIFEKPVKKALLYFFCLERFVEL